MKRPIFMCILVGLISLTLVSIVSAKETITIEIPIQNNQSANPVTGISISLHGNGINIVGVVDDQGFKEHHETAHGANQQGILLKGGDINDQNKHTVKVQVEVNSGSVTCEATGLHRKVSGSNVEVRGTSRRDDIFSKAVFGGSSGITFAGVNIPASQYGYFYQFDRSSYFTDSPDHFDIQIGGGAPTACGFLNNTWAVSTLMNDLPENMATDGSETWQLVDDMVGANLRGVAGVAPSQWSYDSGKMTALFSSSFGLGDISDILWFTSLAEPEFGGPLGYGGENAFIYSGGDAVVQFTNMVVAPIPEPGTWAFVTASGFILVLLRQRRR